MSANAPHLWLESLPLLLASRSEARLGLLRRALIPVEAAPVDIDERAEERRLIAQGAEPIDIAGGLAQAKALAASARHPRRLVLGADQVLEIDGRLLHKAENRAQAEARLARLAGRSHRLHACAALAEDGAVTASLSSSATLWMRPLSGAEITLYGDLAGPALLANVGSYAFEGLGAHLFDRVQGDEATILGLPLLPLLAALRRLGRLAL